jgi:DNA-binding beta-propeller fold protein YncE
MMKRKYINILLIILTLGVVFIITKDFIGNKAGKNIENPYKYDLDEYRKVDSTAILYKETITFPINTGSPKGIAVDGKLILVVTEKLFLTFDYSGKELSRSELPDTASCISKGNNGEIWIGLLHSVCSIDLRGKILATWKTFGDRSVITSLAVSDNSIYVADAGNRIVYQCNLKGEIVSKIGEKNVQKGVPGYVIPSPYCDLAIDDNGFLWVANTGRHTLENYTRDGSLRTSWGMGSTKIDGFFGCCNPAHFAILPDNTFITSEKGIPRIKLYNQDGVFQGIVASPEMFANGWFAPDIAVDTDQRVLALDLDRKQVRIFERKVDGNK